MGASWVKVQLCMFVCPVKVIRVHPRCFNCSGEACDGPLIGLTQSSPLPVSPEDWGPTLRILPAVHTRGKAYGAELRWAEPVPEARQVHTYLAESTVYSPLSSLVQKERLGLAPCHQHALLGLPVTSNSKSLSRYARAFRIRVEPLWHHHHAPDSPCLQRIFRGWG